MHGHFEDKALGFESPCDSSSVRCSSFWESVGCMKMRAPSLQVLKSLTTCAWEIPGCSSMNLKTVSQSASVRFSRCQAAEDFAEVLGVSF